MGVCTFCTSLFPQIWRLDAIVRACQHLNRGIHKLPSLERRLISSHVGIAIVYNQPCSDVSAVLVDSGGVSSIETPFWLAEKGKGA